jgi:hypothetical protein
MLVQTRGAYGGKGFDTTSVECLLSITTLPCRRELRQQLGNADEPGRQGLTLLHLFSST